MLRRQLCILLYFNFNLLNHFPYLRVAWIDLLTLLESLHGLVQFLLIDQGFGLSKVRFDESWFDLNRLVAVCNALFEQQQLKLCVCPIGKVDVVWLL